MQATVWNALPSAERLSDSVAGFKRRLKMFVQLSDLVSSS